MIFCSLVIVGVLSKRRGRALRTPTTPRPASASASAMTPNVRLSLNYCMKGQVVADYVENVKEDASATPILKDLAQSGHKLIFATTFGYMDQTVEAAKQFPNVMFEHCTGYKHLPNLGTYNTRF